jgi:uncharacterized damage-inducible protein DinB
MPLVDAILPEFDYEMANTRKTLERVPEDKFGWKPHEKSGTMIWLAGHVTSGRAALTAATDAQMMQTWTLKAGPQTIFSLPRVAVIRAMVMNHLIHHRAQLTVYLRMNNVPVPALYGPSADEGVSH